jgi:hypothetical protein
LAPAVLPGIAPTGLSRPWPSGGRRAWVRGVFGGALTPVEMVNRSDADRLRAHRWCGDAPPSWTSVSAGYASFCATTTCTSGPSSHCSVKSDGLARSKCSTWPRHLHRRARRGEKRQRPSQLACVPVEHSLKYFRRCIPTPVGRHLSSRAIQLANRYRIVIGWLHRPRCPTAGRQGST